MTKGKPPNNDSEDEPQLVLDFSGASIRDAMLQQVEENSQPWCDMAFDVLLTADLPARFIPEEVRPYVVAKVGKPHHFNAWGALFMKLIKAGVIRRTGELRRAKSEQLHAHTYIEYERVRE